MLWTVRTKGLGRVEEQMVEASSEDRARQVAEAWAAPQGLRVIGVRQAVVADESILAPPKVQETKPVQVTAPIR